MSISACLVTRGDVDLTDIIDSLTPHVDEVIVWDNSKRDDFAVYGRYAAIAEAKHPLIYAQDDDVLLAPESIDEIIRTSDSGSSAYGQLVCNMPANFRHSFYQEHALIGFGSCFHRDLPFAAFDRFHVAQSKSTLEEWFFLRRCDLVFTALTPRVLVDVYYDDLPWASAPNRMWKRPIHVEEGKHMLELIKQVRDAE